MRFLSVLAASSIFCSIGSARSYAYDDPTVPSILEPSSQQPSKGKKNQPSNAAPASPPLSTPTTAGSETPSSDVNTKRIYFGYSQRQIEKIYGVTLSPNTFRDADRKYLEVKLIRCSKIPNSQNVGRTPYPSYVPNLKGKYLYDDEFGSIVCKFSIASNFDGEVTTSGSNKTDVEGGYELEPDSRAMDFQGKGMFLEAMVANRVMKQASLSVKISQSQPFFLTTYFRYKQTGKEINPLRWLRMYFSVEGNNSTRNVGASLTFKSVSVDEFNSRKK